MLHELLGSPITFVTSQLVSSLQEERKKIKLPIIKGGCSLALLFGFFLGICIYDFSLNS